MAKFEVVGMLLGLALFNNVVLGLEFPLPLYKALLSANPQWTLDDLAQVKPTVARNLRSLLDYEGDDVEEVFCLNFTAADE